MAYRRKPAYRGPMPPRRSPLEDRLEAALAASYDREPAARLAAVHELLELAVMPGLPGARARSIVVRLDDLARGYGEPVMRETARAAVAVVTRMVPPPHPEDFRPARDDGPPATTAAELWGIADPAAFDPVRRWGRRPGPAVAFGVAPDGAAVRLDLREVPHALIVGATGSGKTELLRTVVLGLAAEHAPDDLALLVVDRYGAAAFLAFEGLPHLAGLVGDLSGDRATARLLAEVILGELAHRRQWHPRSHLVVVCDDLAEVLAVAPELLAALTEVGRAGGDLGMHLLLASQRYEEGRLRGLAEHLPGRIALRTYSTVESRGVLGVPDAYELPGAPGHGLLRAGSAPPRPFRAAYSSGVYRAGPPSWAQVLEEARTAGPPSLLDVLVGRIAGHGTPTHRLWPPADGRAGFAAGDEPADEEGD
jgi:S-DNA-T family DNA segregation ATPase FtsK/SpoIIIE